MTSGGYITRRFRGAEYISVGLPGEEGTGTGAIQVFCGVVSKMGSVEGRLFRAEKVPLADIHEVDLKQEYSFTSHLTVYENSAEQYRFYKELEFAPVRTNPILFGTLVHETIEDIHKTVLRGKEKELSEDRVARWFDTNYAYLTKKERVYLVPYIKGSHRGRCCGIIEGMRGIGRRSGCGGGCFAGKGWVILRGNVDLIVGENDTVELVDFKSEKKPDVNSPEEEVSGTGTGGSWKYTRICAGAEWVGIEQD